MEGGSLNGKKSKLKKIKDLRMQWSVLYKNIFVTKIIFPIFRHKRKVQNFLPGKSSSSRGALEHPLARGGQPLTYEDPRDTLVMRPYPLDMEVKNLKLNLRIFLGCFIEIWTYFYTFQKFITKMRVKYKKQDKIDS